MGTDQGAPRVRYVRRQAFRPPGHEDGAIAIMAAGALLLLCAFCGLALDLSRVYNRKMEMQSAADAAALAAAIELDGTKAGITRAAQKANALFAIPLTFGGPSVNYRQDSITWSDDAIEFGQTPNGPWIPRDTAAGKTEPNGLLYTRVRTARLDASYGQVSTWLASVVSDDLAVLSTAARAVAGPSAIAVSPLGLCIMRSEPKRSHGGELEEYGFRRGVSYDLMQLNTESSTTGQSFLIHPFTAPGATESSTIDFNTVAPFVCTGTLGIARVTGGKISVSSPFPLGDLYQQLNSRFDSYTLPCNPDTAPPDKNIKEYTYNNGSVPWMGWTAERQSANRHEDTANGNHKLWTVAGPDPSPAGTTIQKYGPLWAYAKAVRYADPMPSGGYVAYVPSTNWKDLYNMGSALPAATSYPSTMPYLSSNATYSSAPSRTGLRDRRILNVPLLECPVSEGKATVKGIGRFFMTVKADTTHLYAEFAGMADEQTLRTRVRLYP